MVRETEKYTKRIRDCPAPSFLKLRRTSDIEWYDQKKRTFYKLFGIT
jgi:hypothetical protein